MERLLSKIDSRVSVSSFVLSLVLILAYVIIGTLAGGSSRVVYDLSLPLFWLLLWGVIYVTGRTCAAIREAGPWVSSVSDEGTSRGRRGAKLCVDFQERALGKWSAIIAGLTYLVSVSYFLVLTLPRVNWRLTELPYAGGLALGIPLTSVPMLLASELLHWAVIRAFSITAIWLALVSLFFLYSASRDIAVKFLKFDHWEMKPLVGLTWSISYSLALAGFSVLGWLPFLAVSALGPGAIDVVLSLVVAVMYGLLAFSISLYAISTLKHMLASVKRDVLSEIHDRLWRIYEDTRTGGKRISALTGRQLEELDIEVAALSKINAEVESKTVFPFSLSGVARLLISPVVYPGVAILREYLRSVLGF